MGARVWRSRAREAGSPGWSLAAPHGLMMTHPFYDPRVVSLGLGVGGVCAAELASRNTSLVELSVPVCCVPPVAAVK